MAEEAGWFDEEVKQQEPVAKAREQSQKRKKASQKGRLGRPVVQRFKVSYEARNGQRGPLVMVYGSGPRTGKCINVPVSPEVVAKIERYGVGPVSQILSLLIDHGLAELEKDGQTIVARSVT